MKRQTTTHTHTHILSQHERKFNLSVLAATQNMVGGASSGAGHLGASDKLIFVGENILELLEG